MVNVKELSGSSINYVSEVNLPLNEAKIYFNPIQDGEGVASPENVREIRGWDGITVYGFNKRLPDEYVEVEYLESTGTQWIDTGVVADASLGYDFTFRFTALQQHDMGVIDGTSGNVKRNHITALYQSTNKLLYLGVNNSTIAIGNTDTDLHTVSLRTTDSSVYVFDGVEHSISKVTMSVDGNFYLFARNNLNMSTARNYAKMQISEAKLYLGDILVRNFIPCYRISDHTPGMWDTVTSTFYTNSGTGDFILGPEVGITIDFPKTIYGGYVDLVRGEIIETYDIISSYDSETLGNQWLSDRDEYEEGTSPTTGAQVAYGLATPNRYPISPHDLRLLKGSNSFSSNSNGDIAISFADSTYEQITGNTVSFDAPVAGKPLEECKIYFTPIQEGSGTPSPDNVRPISGWDSITVMNNTLIAPSMFLPYSGPDKTEPDVVFDSINNTASVTTHASYSGCYCKINVKPNTSYKVGCVYSFGDPSTMGSIAIMKSNNSTVIAQYGDFRGNGKKSLSFNSGNNTEIYVRFYTSRGNNYNGVTTVLSDMFFTESDIDESTSYSLTIPFPRTIYGGYLDLVRGEVVETRRGETLGNHEWTFYNGSTSGGISRWKCTDIPIMPPASTSDMLHGLCDKLETISYNQNWNYSYRISPSSSGNNTVYVILPGMTKTDAVDFLETVTLCYELDSPTHIPLTDPPTIKTLKGINNLITSANGNITVRAVGEVTSPLRSDVLYRRQINSAPHIESVSGSSVQFSTDMETLLKEGRIYFSPKQDLHGYDKPWIGGAVNNMIPDGTDASNGYVSGYYLNADGTTTELASSAWYVSEYFSVEADSTYTWSSVNSSTVAPSICFYDENKEYISGEQANGELPKTLVAPEGAVYCRASQNSNSERLCQFELGSTATTILPYSNVCPIEGWDGITFTITGKNLFSKDCEKLEYVCINSGIIKGAAYYDTYSIPVPKNTVLILSKKKGLGSLVGLSNKPASIGDTISGTITFTNRSSYSFNTGDNSYFIFSITRNNFDECYVQLEFGSIVTTYEPYSGQSFTIPFERTIYGGYVDLINGEVVETWTSKTFNGSGLIDYAGNGYNGSLCTNRYLTFVPNSSQSYQANTAISDYLESKKIAIWSNANNNPNSFTVNGGYQLHFCFSNDLVGIKNEDAMTVRTNKIKTYISEHPVQIVYPLTTNSINHFTLSDLSTIRTLVGTNTLISTSNGNIAVSYYRHGDDITQYIPAQAIATNDNYLIVTDDGFVIGDEENITVY